jgi:hypothetical protein
MKINRRLDIGGKLEANRLMGTNFAILTHVLASCIFDSAKLISMDILREKHMDKVEELLRISNQLPSKRKELTEKEYLQFLEETIRDLSQWLNKFFLDYLQLGRYYERAFTAFRDLEKRNKWLSKELAKHRKGKQYLPEDLLLFHIIEEIDQKRIAQGERSNYMQSARNAVFQMYHTKNETTCKRYYRNFNGYKNKDVKAKKKSVLRKIHL